MAILIFEDENGHVLWERPDGERHPIGTLITGFDGTRYLLAKVVRVAADGPEVTYRMRLRPC